MKGAKKAQHPNSKLYHNS